VSFWALPPRGSEACTFLSLKRYKTIVLLVKAQWESFLVAQTNRIEIDWLNKVGCEDYLPAFMENEAVAQELSETWVCSTNGLGIPKTRISSGAL
jgi:hypothetical protein